MCCNSDHLTPVSRRIEFVFSLAWVVGGFAFQI
jgi:hypothetical protein